MMIEALRCLLPSPFASTISRAVAVVLLASAGSACAHGAPPPVSDAGACRVTQAATPLPREVLETSGLARGTRTPGIYWTHNDSGGDPEVFAVDSAGRLRGRVRVTGARARDWEDASSGPCGAAGCLYLGDIGDNGEEREHVTIYRVAEPLLTDAATAPAEPLMARYPTGAADAEALFVLAPGDVYVVSKGRSGPQVLYRFPRPLSPGRVVELETVRTLFPRPGDWPEQVTAAAASPDGRHVAVRTYRTLYIYRTDELLGAGAEPRPVVADLTALAEPQGEAVALANGGAVTLSSEGRDGAPPSLLRLQCRLP